MKPARYHKLSAADKEAHARDKLREPAIVCPYCETKTTVEALLPHIAERCPGRRPPHPRSKWVTWGEALARGASRASLHEWVERGVVRTSGSPGNRVYLLRDLVRALAYKTSPGVIRSSSDTRTARKQRRKRLTNRRSHDHRRGMDKPLDAEITGQLDAMAKELGGIAPTSRKLGIPEQTVRSALKGNNLRTGTRLLIAQRLEEAKSP